MAHFKMHCVCVCVDVCLCLAKVHSIRYFGFKCVFVCVFVYFEVVQLCHFCFGSRNSFYFAHFFLHFIHCSWRLFIKRKFQSFLIICFFSIPIKCMWRLWSTEIILFKNNNKFDKWEEDTKFFLSWKEIIICFVLR